MRISFNHRAKLATSVLLIGLIAIGWLLFTRQSMAAPAEIIQWDIVLVDTTELPIINSRPGGRASAVAGDLFDEGPSITLTGTGTFVVPGGGRSNAVTGGGTWETFAADGSSAATGTFEVTSLVSWNTAPGTLPTYPFIDHIGNNEDTVAGLAIMTVRYSDGSEGILLISCNLPTTPPEVAATIHEGISVTKGNVHYWYRADPVFGLDGDGVNVFHYVRNP